MDNMLHSFIVSHSVLFIFFGLIFVIMYLKLYSLLKDNEKNIVNNKCDNCIKDPIAERLSVVSKDDRLFDDDRSNLMSKILSQKGLNDEYEKKELLMLLLDNIDIFESSEERIKAIRSIFNLNNCGE